MIIRSAKDKDLPEIARIYNQAILETTATFDTVPKSVEEWRETLASHNDKFPLVVAEYEGKIVGWGSLRPFIKRPAARFTVENAVYVDQDYHGRGIGSAILKFLLECAQREGHHAVVALVVAGNTPSERLHRKLGFETIGVLREVGHKFGRWLDLMVLEKLL
ncbi:MAG: N-acetyltransferase family protein [Armatimonadota bacterium]|nr:N-acetyltransferase family protein [Armatimonadota bacterium]